MTIRDLIEQGIYLQGWIKVRKWDVDFNNSDRFITLLFYCLHYKGIKPLCHIATDIKKLPK